LKVKGRGNPNSRVLFLGEGPGEQEDLRGIAFIGAAGRVLNATCAEFGIDLASYWVDNLVKYRVPGNADPSDADIARDAWELELFFMENSPTVVVTLGKVATRWALGDDWDMDECHGLAYRRTIFGVGVVVMPAYHPAAGLHNPDALGMFRDDICKIAKALEGQTPDWAEEDNTKPGYFDKSFGSTMILPRAAVDTEGTAARPYCLSFSYGPGHGVVVKPGAGSIRVKGRITFHNALWDIGVLRSMDVEVDEFDDTMIMAYVLQDIPRGLKALARRFCGMRMVEYRELTFPYDRAQALAYIDRVRQYDWGKPEPVLDVNRIGGSKVRQPKGLNSRVESIAKKALQEPTYDPRKAWFDIDASTREAAECLLDPMPEFTLDLVPYELVVPYAARDADSTRRLQAKLEARMDEVGVRPVYEMDLAVLPMVERMQQNGIKIDRDHFPKIHGEFQREMDVLLTKIAKFNRGQRINPISSDQTAELLFRRLRLRPTKFTKTRKPSTQDKVLESLKGQHPVVGFITDYRERATLDDKFAKILPQFADRDDRIRGKIKPTTVVSGRYSMEDPNLMAIPTRTEEGKKIRRGFIAEPGHLLGSCDQDQIEMRVMAHLSRDVQLCKLFNEGRDVHSDTASRIFGVPLDQVHPLLHRYPAKRVGFGVITGIEAVGLLDQYKLAGIFQYDEDDCARHIQEWFKVYRGVKTFLHTCREEAKSQGYVKCMWGRIRYLPGVYSNDKVAYGEALRASHSHKISASAQGMMKRGMKRAWDWYKANPGKYEPLLQIHDELVVESPERHTDEVGKMLVWALTGDKLCVPVKAKVGWGRTWADVKD
jgi:uracil-DNA glycosylase family 4